MMYAYDKIYLDVAQTALGCMLDFAVNDLKYELDVFYKLFITSGISRRFESGDPSIVAGRSGVELAYDVILKTTGSVDIVVPQFRTDRSKEYWTGWALAYYQWEKDVSFSDINAAVSIDTVKDLYSPYHEMDIRQFVDQMNELYRFSSPETRLKAMRMRMEITQRKLAELTGIPQRTIQQYEQRQKNINKAQAEYLLRLSKVLKCNMEELLER